MHTLHMLDYIPETFNNGAAGILVPDQNAQALQEEIVVLLLDPDKLQVWKTNARANVDTFTGHHAVNEIDKVYCELLTPLPLGAHS